MSADKGKKGKRASLRIWLWRLLMAGALFVGLFAAFLTFVFLTLDAHAPFTIPKREPGILFLARDGARLMQRGAFFGDAARLAKLPPYVPQAFVAIEDRRFWHHPGIDPFSLARALWVDLRAGRVVQGGSTITQQLAKNLFLRHRRTLWRKAQEAALALWLEWKLSKRRILELYLNRVYFGAGAWGIEQAARRYFGKPARELSLGEAALLAGLVQAPSRYNPLRHRRRALARAQVVLRRMVAEGYISRAQARRALNGIRFHPTPIGGTSALDYAADWIIARLPQLIGSFRESIVVETTLDARIQRLAARALRRTLARDGRRRRVGQGAIVVMGRDGAVRAMVGGRRYTRDAFNRATQARRQPGSAFKPFVFLAALEAGYTPLSVLNDRPVRIGRYAPRNYDNRYYGPVTLTTALARSLNSVAVQLALKVGPKRVVETAYRLGISSPLKAVPAIALGVSEVTPLELLAAYAPFANGGKLVVPYAVRRILTRSGKVLYERRGPGLGRVVSARHVGMMNFMLRAVVREGTARRAAFAGQDIAGKTGTSQHYRDAWFVGFTGHMLAVVWLGNDDATPMRRVSGGTLPARLWRQVMQPAHAGLPFRSLPGRYAPPPSLVRSQPPMEDFPQEAAIPSPRQPQTVLDFLIGLFR